MTSRIQTSANKGTFYSPAAPATPVTSGVYAWTGVVTDTVIAVLDTQGGNTFLENPKALAMPTLYLSGATAATDVVMTVLGLDTLPTGSPTYADYRNLGEVLWPAKRYTRASVTEGAAQDFRPLTHRYIVFVATSTAVAPGGNVTPGLRVYDWQDNRAQG